MSVWWMLLPMLIQRLLASSRGTPALSSACSVLYYSLAHPLLEPYSLFLSSLLPNFFWWWWWFKTGYPCVPLELCSSGRPQTQRSPSLCLPTMPSPPGFPKFLILLIVFLFCFSETGFLYTTALAVLELTLWTRLSWSSQRSAGL